MKILRNAISRILARDAFQETRLGCPSPDQGAYERRMNAMFAMTGGRGFQVPPKGPKLSKGGETRKELEANGKAIFAQNLARESAFRAARAGQPGWGIAAIRRAIEQRQHLVEEAAK